MTFRSFYVGLFAVSLALPACSSAPEPEPAAEEIAESPALEQMLTGDHIATDAGDLIIHPIAHATFYMGWDGKTILVDPVGGAEPFEGLPSPDLILLTDIHGDHLDNPTLEAVVGADTVIVAPAAVVAQLPEGLAAQARTLDNGAELSLLNVGIEAIPMYNLTEDRLQFHDKGRGNGYVVTVGGKRIYISGDTEDILEMRALQNIDVAFVCFNLPYTMTEEQAASAVREFAPGIVYPYHYMGSDTEAFAALVAEADGIEVRNRAWY
jgi:L-ascorbate metabolism protein UlaG (beta-lactamase superfamily)